MKLRRIYAALKAIAALGGIMAFVGFTYNFVKDRGEQQEALAEAEAQRKATILVACSGIIDSTHEFFTAAFQFERFAKEERGKQKAVGYYVPDEEEEAREIGLLVDAFIAWIASNRKLDLEPNAVGVSDAISDAMDGEMEIDLQSNFTILEGQQPADVLQEAIELNSATLEHWVTVAESTRRQVQAIAEAISDKCESIAKDNA